jgi:hypothetical protein
MRIGDVLIWEDGKDGGPESKVFGKWIFRIKSLFTMAVLRFDEGSREAYHAHAFNCVSWVLRGELEAHMFDGTVNTYRPSFRPIVTRRDTFHKVYGRAPATWVFTLRGPWVNQWKEYIPESSKMVTLTHNRKEIDSVIQ